MLPRAAVGPVLVGLATAVLVTVAAGAACGGGSSGTPAAGEPAAAASPSPVPHSPPARRTGRGLNAPDVPVFPGDEMKVATVPPGPMPTEFVFSAAAQRVAWTERSGGAAALDGHVLARADRMDGGMFSPNGQYFAYVAIVGTGAASPEPGGPPTTESFVVVGDVEFGPYERIELLHVGNDGHVQFIVGRPGQRVLMNDDVPGPVFAKIDRIDLVRASDDGPVLAYRAAGDDGPCAIIGTQAQCYASVGRPVLSPSGASYGYAAAQPKGVAFVVVDGKPSPQQYPHVDWRIAINDEGRVAYVAQVASGGRQVNIDGTLGREYDRIVHLTQSPDGKAIAYAAFRAGAWRLVVQTDEQPKIEGEIKEIVLGPLGAGPVGDAGGQSAVPWALITRSEEGVRVVSRATTGTLSTGPLYKDVRWLQLRADGARLAYVAKSDAGAMAVFDGKVGEPYDEVGDPRFFADGRTSYIARRGQAWFFVTTGQTYGPYDDIGPRKIIAGVPRHNYAVRDDGKHWILRARMGQQWRVVLDGELGPLFDEVWGAPFSWDAAGDRVGYFARSGDELWWRMQPFPVP